MIFEPSIGPGLPDSSMAILSDCYERVFHATLNAAASSVRDILPGARPHIRLRYAVAESPGEVDERHTLAHDALSPDNCCSMGWVCRCAVSGRSSSGQRTAGVWLLPFAISPISGAVPTSAACGRLLLSRVGILMDVETLGGLIQKGVIVSVGGPSGAPT